MKTRFLLPNRYKKIGWILLIPASLFGVFVVLTDFEPDWLRLPVFTFFSEGTPFSGQGTTSFSTIKNNVANEIAGILFLISAMMVAFSKAKDEDEFIVRIRLESLVWATYVHFALLLIGMLFLYDFEFFHFMIYNMFTLLILFIAKFNIALHKSKKQ